MATATLLSGYEQLRHRWGWVLALGIAMVVLGSIALIEIPTATLATVIVLAWLMIVSGILETVYAFQIRQSHGMFLHLIGGVLGILIGALVLTHPLAGALVFTLLFACFLTVAGLFRTITAIQLKLPHWGWSVFDGLVTLALGFMVWMGWPVSTVWFLGLAVGISLLLRGWSYIMLAFAVRRIPVPLEIRRAA